MLLYFVEGPADRYVLCKISLNKKFSYLLKTGNVHEVGLSVACSAHKELIYIQVNGNKSFLENFLQIE